MPDFTQPHHLPNRGGNADPKRLPRQRRGITPQLHGRYPDYDVLENADHWDEVTRAVVLDRVDNVPPIRFFEPQEVETLTVLCDLVTAQDEEPRIPVLRYVDEKLHDGRFDGYRYFELPDDRETWRAVARGLAEEASAQGAASFAALGAEQQYELVHRFSRGALHGGVWATLPVARAWGVVMRYVLEAFYSHPWAWNEIGFGSPAYPRGYSRFGSPHLEHGETETWEGREAFDLDPVQDAKRRGLE